MPYGEYAECPCCKKKALGKIEIEKHFGYRVVSGNKKIPQSYCKICRVAKCEAGNPKH